MTQRTLLAHCDWSKDPRKRWAATAVLEAGLWRLAPPEPVGSTAAFIPRLRRRARGGGILVGFDFPIGLPRAYGERTGLANFSEALGQFGRGPWRDWWEVCGTVEEVSLRRPFFPVRQGGRSRAQLFGALGLAGEDLLRLCERATPDRPAACMLFWTLGGNQVGKAAITGWRELLAPQRDAIGLWPFDGSLAALDRTHECIVVETYPGEVYGHLRIPRRPVWSKRRRDGRRSVARYLLDWFDQRPVVASVLTGLARAGFSDGPEGEDQFDAVVGLLGMLDVLESRRPDGAPASDAVTTWEGWILGQAPPPTPLSSVASASA
jgi:hypothetical protein